MNTVYKPKGAAAEYGDYAVNIYTGGTACGSAGGAGRMRGYESANGL